MPQNIPFCKSIYKLKYHVLIVFYAFPYFTILIILKGILTNKDKGKIEINLYALF